MINELLDWAVEKVKQVEILENRVFRSTKDSKSYPCAVIHFTAREKSDASTNMTTSSQYRYTIQVYYDITSDSVDVEEVDRRLYDIADEIFEIFDNLRNAEGKADYLNPNVGTCAWLDDSRQKRYTEITLVFDVETPAN